ncbi:hypothetical protein ACFZC6_02115 [Streptomyces ossamyceticus]|uniref:hypothetical protein n=1 Tax=Streptomyces ossamyceticus TaxID=249581 RepID=UPI0036E12B4C
MRDIYGPDDEFGEDELDVADEVALADTGRSWGASDIKHLAMRATRKHLAANPLPGQRSAGAA